MCVHNSHNFNMMSILEDIQDIFPKKLLIKEACILLLEMTKPASSQYIKPIHGATQSSSSTQSSIETGPDK